MKYEIIPTSHMEPTPGFCQPRLLSLVPSPPPGRLRISVWSPGSHVRVSLDLLRHQLPGLLNSTDLHLPLLSSLRTFLLLHPSHTALVWFLNKTVRLVWLRWVFSLTFPGRPSAHCPLFPVPSPGRSGCRACLPGDLSPSGTLSHPLHYS